MRSISKNLKVAVMRKPAIKIQTGRLKNQWVHRIRKELEKCALGVTNQEKILNNCDGLEKVAVEANTLEVL
jgi:hypothetical protein